MPKSRLRRLANATAFCLRWSARTAARSAWSAASPFRCERREDECAAYQRHRDPGGVQQRASHGAPVIVCRTTQRGMPDELPQEPAEPDRRRAVAEVVQGDDCRLIRRRPLNAAWRHDLVE